MWYFFYILKLLLNYFVRVAQLSKHGVALSENWGYLQWFASLAF